jgi:type I restriction enzyme S subunit
MLSDKLFRFVFRKPLEIDLAFLDHAMKSPALREQIVAGATGTSPTMKNISKDKVLALQIPYVGLEQQRRIVVALGALQQRIDAAKRLQSETALELNAMLPAILDKAFRGDL